MCELESFANRLDAVIQAMNKYNTFAFTTHGAFKAEVLNAYNIRFEHEIMYEEPNLASCYS